MPSDTRLVSHTVRFSLHAQTRSTNAPLHHRHQSQPVDGCSPHQPASPARRDLIREYFARNATPPAIFKPSFKAFSPPPVLQLAYTHPALLLLDDDDDDNNATHCAAASKAVETDRAVDETYVSGNSVKFLLDTTAAAPGRPIRPASFRLRRSAFSSIDLRVAPSDASSPLIETNPANVGGDGALAVGTVTANLIRTWEQLNAANSPAASAAAATASTAQPMLRAPVPLPRRSATAAGLSRLAAAEDDDFYDSIDDDDQLVSELERIPSMCCGAGDELDCAATVGGVMAVAGEAMAQFESLDKRKICWSMDSV